MPVFQNGKTFIYKLWKSLLNRWLSTPDCEVFLGTPFLDDIRMTDICRMVIKHRNTANIKAFYVRKQCYFDKSIIEVIEGAKFQDEEIIKIKVHKSLKIDPSKCFHGKFIGCTYKTGAAEVLVTSANFTRQHFSFDNLETVGYNKITTAEFENVIKPFETLTLQSLGKVKKSHKKIIKRRQNRTDNFFW